MLYELGIRHAFDKPVVLVQEAGQSRIFDITGVTTVDYRKARRYDEVLEDQKKITDALIETADTEKNYSFMKLVNLMPVSIEKHDSQATSEERIEILLQDLAQKVNKIEGIINYNAAGSNGISTITANTDIYKQRSSESVLLRKISEAKKLIDLAKDKRNAVPGPEIMEAYVGLSDALEQYKAFVCENNIETDRAVAYLNDLINILN